MDYERVMTALRKRRWMIITSVLACTLFTAAGSTRMKKEYQASATLMPQDRALADINEMTKPAEAGTERPELTLAQDRIKTISSILTSPAVLGPVIQDQHMNITLQKLQERIEVKELTSQVLRVTVRDENRDRAAAIVNEMVENCVKLYSDVRSREARGQVTALTQQRDKADAELRRASASLETFKRRRHISSLPDQVRNALDHARSMSEDRSKTEAQLRDVSATLASVQDQLARTPATREVRKEATQTALLDKLRLDVSDLKTQLAQAQTKYTDEHPTVARLKQQLSDAENRLNTESSKRSTTVEVIPNPDREILLTKQRDLTNQRDGLTARVARLSGDLATVQSQATSYSGTDVELGLLAQRYSQAETRLANITASLTRVENVARLLVGSNPISIVDKADALNPPFDMTQGRSVKLAAIAFVMSLAVCIALAIALEMADRRVRSIEDAENLTRLPVVSVVPQLPGRGNAGMLCLTAENDPASHLAEAYHFLANHILRQTLRRESTVMMAATARPGQGATTALSNLAIALARAGRQVVLVEADLRRPFLHTVFETGERPGLTDALQGRVTVREALCNTDVDNLRLIPGGANVKDPWSLLWQPSMGNIVSELREMADYVIFNVPSATVFADALCVAPHVDGAVMVMRTSETPSGAEEKVREWLAEVNVPVMGVVLNGVPSRDMESFEFHRSYNARRADMPHTPALGSPVVYPVREAA